MNKELKAWEKVSEYSDEDINELASWCESLTIAQLMFIRDLYQSTLDARAWEVSSQYVQ